MNSKKILAAFAIIALAASCTSANSGMTSSDTDSTATKAAAVTPAKPVNPKSLLPSSSEIDSVSYLIGVNFGSFIKGYNFGDDLNYAQIKRGIKDFLNAKGKYTDSTYAEQFKINPEKINDMFNAFLAKRSDYTKAVNKQKGEKFLAENKNKDSVQTSVSGLQYIIRNAGNDVKPGPTDTVYVHYKGTLLDGTVFDESPKNAEGTRLMLNRVVPGWTEGLQLIGEGGKMRLFVPSELAYGENGTRGIEPNSTLIFDLELVKVNKFVPKPEEKDNK